MPSSLLSMINPPPTENNKNHRQREKNYQSDICERKRTIFFIMVILWKSDVVPLSKKLWIFLQMINIQTRYSNDCPSSEETTEDGNVVWSLICDKLSFLSWGLISEEALLLSPPTKSVTLSVLKVLKYFSASRPSGSMVAKRTSFEKWSPLVMVLAILIFLFLQTQYPWSFWQTSACALSIENNFFLVLDLTIWYLNIIRTGSRGAQYLSTKLSELGIQSNTTMRIRSAKYATPLSPKKFPQSLWKGGWGSFFNLFCALKLQSLIFFWQIPCVYYSCTGNGCVLRLSDDIHR